MKRNGNNAVNKTYNSKNKKPDMPVDADEVDSAMERFIRKKYQEKSLSAGKPEPPQRDETPPSTYSRPQEQESPPPALPPKKGKFFGFGLRASSSAYPLSKHDKKKLPKEPRVDSTFRIADGDYDVSRMADARFEMTDAELQKKLTTLRDMGFTETERNTNLLRRLNGNVERTIETLVQLGSSENGNPASTRRHQQDTSATSTSTPRTSEPSYNPFTKITSQQTFGLSMAEPQEPSTPNSSITYGSNNPYGQSTQGRPETGLEQSFQSMQLAQPLFPNSTGGYPSQPAPLQDPRSQYSMTPPVTSTYQQTYVASPAATPMTSNPFFQPPPVSVQPNGNNPFSSQGPNPSLPSTDTNPFLSLHSTSMGQQVQNPPKQNSLPASFNPFGIPPSHPPPQATQQIAAQPFSRQDLHGATPSSHFTHLQNNPFQPQVTSQQQQPHPQSGTSQFQQSPSSAFPNPQYGQPATQPQTQMTMTIPEPQQQQQQYYQQQFTPQAQPFMPQHSQQHTGRYDKNTIMALYNYPQLAPSQPLASIPEPAAETSVQQQAFQPHQQISPAPSGDIFSNISPAKRSATMPVSLSNMHSAGGAGNRNPFMTTTNAHYNHNPFQNGGAGTGAVGFAPSPAQGQGIGARHTSAESMSINHLESGRHSPDAFANLSARYRG